MEITGAAWFSKFRKSINSSSSWCERVGLGAMAAIGLATLIDVIGSKVFKWPLPGSTEMIGVIQVIAIAGGLAFSKIDGRHIRVDIFIDYLPKRGKAALDVFSSILGLGLFAVAGWMAYRHGLSLFNSGTKTFLLGIPLSPFAFWIAVCCIPMCCVIILELLSSIERMLK
jgi:TRAP-type C4-dicarboxylate transport system permease small subunit